MNARHLCARCNLWNHTEATDTVFYGECQGYTITDQGLVQVDPFAVYGKRLVTYASFGCVGWAEKQAADQSAQRGEETR